MKQKSEPLYYFEYRRTMVAIGATMLVFLALFMLLSMSESLRLIAFGQNLSRTGEIVFTILRDVIGYTACFMIPVFFLRRFLRVGPVSLYRPMHTEAKVPGWRAVAYVLVVLAVLRSAAYVNSFLVSLVPFKITSGTGLVSLEPYQIVLQFIAVGLVPAFCEEFLFRGAICTQLMRFGRMPAILVSSLLFALMHQNGQQFLYTFVGGLALGFLYTETGTIWCGVLAHFWNNFLSVTEEVLASSTGVVGEPLYLALELLTLVAGLCAAAYLLYVRVRDKKEPAKTGIEGAFGPDSVPEAAGQPDRESAKLPGAIQLRLFFNVPMILFVVLAVIEGLTMVLIL